MKRILMAGFILVVVVSGAALLRNKPTAEAFTVPDGALAALLVLLIGGAVLVACRIKRKRETE